MEKEIKGQNEKVDSEETIKVIREEYEKKLQEQAEQHKLDLEQLQKDLEEKHIKQIKALFSGRDTNYDKPKETPQEEKSWLENAIDETRQALNLKH